MTERPLRATVHQKAALFGPGRDVLLLRDPDDGWEFPGGRLGVGERPLDGLRREVREETGLAVEVDRPVHTAAWRSSGTNRFVVVYRCTTDGARVELSEEHVEHRWATPAEASAVLSERLATGLEYALDGGES
ncbi:NUDIX domain-containing protein [Halomarina ordinaria]|uniref:NUDIX domain-containing protein n=1 Tax=Halomarina ordinaria TaxID=3033939 RepID=A0ABD5UBC7_9EURY|nr:NUDIX domain-containing protein [Halomarina sp. PSRA2]